MNFWARLTLLDFRATQRRKIGVTPRLWQSLHTSRDRDAIPALSVYRIHTRGGRDVEIIARTLSMMERAR